MPCVAVPFVDLKRVSVIPIRAKGETLEMFYMSEDENKAMNVRLNDKGCYFLRRYMVRCLFDIPTVEAARILCVSLSLLKKIRSWANLGCWPCSLIHSGEHTVYTREEIVEGRDAVIAALEMEFVQRPSSALGLTVQILKEVRQYAALYLRLVIPGAGRRNKRKFAEAKVRKIVAEDRVGGLVELMKPRQVVNGRGGISVGVEVAETAMETLEDIEADIWCARELDYFSDVEDELGLGPVKILKLENE